MIQKMFFTKFEYGYQNNMEFHADFESVEKNTKHLFNKKLIGKIKCRETTGRTQTLPEPDM
jgi:hypothetical protein